MSGALRGLLLTAAALCSTPAPAERESWYAYWGLGVSSTDYPPAVEATFAQGGTVPGASRDEISLEALGFYWPLRGTSTLVGGVMNISYDSQVLMANDDVVAHLVEFDQSLYAFSMMHFWGDEPGKGFFVRGDVGLAEFDFTSIYGPPVSGTGFGTLVGTGYGFAPSSGTRVILNLTYSSKLLEGETYSTSAANVALLW